MVVFLAFYTLNFDFVHSNGNVEKFLHDNGLSPSFQNVIPIAVLLVAIKIQFDFFSVDFHSFMQELAEGNARPSSVEELPAKNANVKLAAKIQRFFSELAELIWLAAAVHMNKIILIALMCAILHERSAFNFVLLIGFCCLCQFSSQFQKITQNVLFILCCSVIIMRMLYATSLNTLFNTDNFANCSSSENDEDPNAIFPWTKSIYRWIGLEMKNQDLDSLLDSSVPLDYLWPYLIVITLALLNALIGFRMNAKVAKLGRKREFAESLSYDTSAERYNNDQHTLEYCLQYRVLFPRINRKNADEGFTNMFLYFVNFGFYKFGLETVILFVVILAGKIGDFFSVFHILFLIPMIICRRNQLKMYAKVFALYSALVLLIKYLLLLWLPPFETFCGSSFLEWIQDESQNSESIKGLNRFFFLYDFSGHSSYDLSLSDLYADMMLLIILRSFLKNLKAEIIDHTLRESAGNNEDCLEEPDMARCQYGRGVTNRIIYSTTNFLTEQKHPMNVLKKVLFMHGIWFTYFFVCFCGLQTYDILGAPFIGFSVYLLWLGQDVALKTRPNTYKFVNRVLLFVVLVASFRVMMQVGGFYCTDFPSLATLESFIEILDMRVLSKYDLYITGSNLKCDGLFDYSCIISWESTCIMILLIQRRIFISHYYDFVIEESIVFRDLSKAGGKLIEKFNKQDIAAAIAYRNQITQELESQISAIRNRNKNSGSWYEPKNHLDAIFNGSRFFSDSTDPHDSSNETRRKSFKRPSSGPSYSYNSSSETGNQWILYIEKIKEKTLDRCFPREPVMNTSSIIEEKIGKQATEVEDSKNDDIEVVSHFKSQENDADPLAQHDAPSTSSAHEDTLEEIVETGSFANGDDISIQTSQTQLTENSEVESLETGPPTGMKKIMLLTTYAFFRVLAEIGYIFDQGSIAFHRILLSLEQQRSKRKGFLETLTMDKLENDLEDRVTSNNYVCVDMTVDTLDDFSRKPSRFQQHLDSEQAFNIYVLFIRDFWLSFYQFLISQTDHFCYFLIGIVVVLNGSIMDMSLSIITITWGLLSKPRPTKRFWKVIIFYTTVIIFVQWFFQTNIFEFNRDDGVSAPVWMETLIGNLDTTDSYVYVLLLLVALCFHRNILLSYGLWSSYSSNRSEQESYNREFLAESFDKRTRGRSEQSLNYDSSVDKQKERKMSVHESSVDMATGLRCTDNTANLVKKSSYWVDFKYWALDVKNECKYFTRQILDCNKTAIRDVYVPMFIFDLLGYVIVTLGYSGFSESGQGSSIIESLLNNSVPFYFLIIILILFAFTMIDRLAYLTKNVLTKLVGFIAQVILVHVWLILLNPLINESTFHSNSSALLFYLVRWIYWVISAYQIKCSFPVRVLGNCFSKRYNKVCKLLMLVFFNAPFLFELRVIMDWVFTPTTLKFKRWLEVEDAFVKTFLIKCERADEISDFRKRGEVQKAFPSKTVYLVIFMALVLVIWAPILLFSFVNETKISTDIRYAAIDLQLGSFEPIFKSSFTTARNGNFANASYLAAENGYVTSSLSSDTQTAKVIVFNPSAQTIWSITPPARKSLYSDLLTCDRFELTIGIDITRRSESSDATITQPQASTQVRTELDIKTCRALACMIKLNNSNYNENDAFCDSSNPVEQVELKNVLPVFYDVDNDGNMNQLSLLSSYNASLSYLSINISLQNDNETSSMQWWNVDVAHATLRQLLIVTFDDKVVPQVFNSLASYGIVGLYITFVIVAASKIKAAFSNYSEAIMFQELPNVDIIQKLVLEMYMCREMKHFELEEDLYSQLQYLYRSPASMIDSTKFKPE